MHRKRAFVNSFIILSSTFVLGSPKVGLVNVFTDTLYFRNTMAAGVPRLLAYEMFDMPYILILIPTPYCDLAHQSWKHSRQASS